MPKFSATSIKDFLTYDAIVGRLARQNKISVCVEVDDGSWCELDADDAKHGRLLADTWVECHNARGASCWIVLSDGTLSSFPFYLVVETRDENGRDYKVLTDREVHGI